MDLRGFIIRSGAALLLAAAAAGAGEARGFDVKAAAGAAARGIGAFTDARDGRKYKTVKIGGATWMAENLNYLPESGKSWCYDDDGGNCAKYGRLYEWNTAMSACPDGWRLPARRDWDLLGRAAGGRALRGATYQGDDVGYIDVVHWFGAGEALKAAAGWDGGGGGTDAYGFSALPGGYRHDTEKKFHFAGSRGHWWTATENGAGRAYDRDLYRNEDTLYEYGGGLYRGGDILYEYDGGHDFGLSVRCVRNE